MPQELPAAPGYADTADVEAMSVVEREAERSPLLELGVTGLKRAAGYVDEEFLPQLRGRKGVQVYREMGDNSPIVGSLLFSITQLIANIDWNVNPAGKTRDHNNAAKLVETSQDDMEHPWKEMIAEITWGMLQYGWDWREPVFKKSVGPWQRDPATKSKYTDGLMRWRKIPVRAQETLLRWAWDDNAELLGMVQLAPPDYRTRYLPLSRSLLFRYGTHKDNPEGRSLLRNAYRPWFYLKRLEEFEAVGVERDLAGLPMVYLPQSYLTAKPGTPQYKMAQSLTRLVRGMRRNENEGVLFPRDIDDDTKQNRFEFELLGSGGQRQFTTDEIIQRYEARILMTCLADFIMVGHTETGTYNMHVDKTGIFRTALNGIAESIADVFNRHAIPELFRRNGWKPAELPTIQPSNVDAADLTQLSQFLTATAGVGVDWQPDADINRWLRQQAGMPELAADDDQRQRRAQRYAEAARLAQIQTEQLAARSQLAQALAAEKMTAAGEPTPEHAQLIGAARGQQQQLTQGAQQQDMDAQRFQLEQGNAKLQQAQGWQQLFGDDNSSSNGNGGSKGGGRR